MYQVIVQITLTQVMMSIVATFPAFVNLTQDMPAGMMQVQTTIITVCLGVFFVSKTCPAAIHSDTAITQNTLSRRILMPSSAYTA
jgi:hypothetical protein